MLIKNFQKISEILEYLVTKTSTDKVLRQNDPKQELAFLKMILLKRYYGVNNLLLYELLKDRLSFQHFIGLERMKGIPNIKDFEKFESSIDSATIFALFEKLDILLLEQGIRISRVITTEAMMMQDKIPQTGVCNPELMSCIHLPELDHPFFLRTGTSDLDVYTEIFTMGIYKVDLNFEPNYIIDCGGNIGMASIFFKYRYPQSRILAIEPETSNFNLMERNLSYYFPSVRCIKGAIWNRATKLSVLPDHDNQKWGYTVNEKSEATEVVQSHTIDSLMKQYNWPQIDLLKIDIEGSEKELFQGGFLTWLSKIKIIMIELHEEIKAGCSKNFFSALSHFNFSISMRGNTFICNNIDNKRS